MIRASVTTPVIGTGSTIDAYRPRIVDIPGVHVFSDVTGANAPITPNAIVCEAIFTDEAFALVEADPEYLVNWSEVV